MIRHGRRFMVWAGMAGLLATLALEGCATKSTVATTAGTDQGSAVAQTKTETAQKSTDQGNGQNQPLTDFSKTPGEERVTSPMTVAKATQEEINARKVRENAGRELGDIYFAFDKWALSSDGKKNLVTDADALKQDPTAPILIEGYCDERGSREYNLVLGDKRAKEAQQYLLALGIRKPIKVISYGKERQVCDEHDESCYWKNRRAHLLIEKGK